MAASINCLRAYGQVFMHPSHDILIKLVGKNEETSWKTEDIPIKASAFSDKKVVHKEDRS